MDDNRRRRGIDKFAEVMGFALPDTPGDPFLDSTFEHLFAELWSRPGLSRRDRRLITLSALACYGNEAALGLHIQAALSSGDLSAEELDELALHLAHYAGWPAGAVTSQVIRQHRSRRKP